MASKVLGYPVLGCEPYPCLCRWIETKPCSSKWCDCRGRMPEPHLPTRCCANRPDNPALVPAGTASAAPVASSGAERYADSPEALSVRGEPRQTPSRATPVDALPPRLRLFDPAELTCDCATPWDGLKTGYGIHCTDCHRNFKNAVVASVHRRWVTDPCRDLREVADPGTGRRLFRVTLVGGLPVWLFDA